MSFSVQVDGLRELMTACQKVDEEIPRQAATALREGSVMLRGRAMQLAPDGQRPHDGPKLRESMVLFARSGSAGFTVRHPGGGVQEFARSYPRRSRSGGTHQVTMRNVGPTPRFAFRALNELSSQLEKLAEDALAEAYRQAGFDVT